MYFIYSIRTYSSTNRKGEELNSFISRYTDTLIHDELSLDAVKQEIETEIERLNVKYPKTRKLHSAPLVGHGTQKSKES